MFYVNIDTETEHGASQHRGPGAWHAVASAVAKRFGKRARFERNDALSNGSDPLKGAQQGRVLIDGKVIEPVVISVDDLLAPRPAPRAGPCSARQARLQGRTRAHHFDAPSQPEVTPMIIHSTTGRSFHVGIVYKGGAYGRNKKLTHDHAVPMVEFYDTAHAGKEGFDPEGQFVQRYNVNTLANHKNGVGLSLLGYEPLWSIDGNALLPVLWLCRELCKALDLPASPW